MNWNKKSTTPSLNRQAGSVQFKPVVAQLKTGISAQSIKRPVAPPVYRPEAKKIVQPKPISQQAKIANSIRPITTKTTTSRFFTVQMAAAKVEEKKAHACSAKVVSSTGQEYKGDYSVIHAEINALEKYFAAGGNAAGIARIELSSSPCKYCFIILSDLGIGAKVVTADKRKYGRCQGGSYGWFERGGSLWKAIKATGFGGNEDAYAASVIERKSKLK